MKKIILTVLGISIAFSVFVSTKDIKKEIVVDSNTNLMWQDNTDVQNIKIKWIEAIDYCENLTLAGFDNWRLPNIVELKSILDLDKLEPAIIDVFVNTSSSFYWSSTSGKSFTYGAWGVDFYDGIVDWNVKSRIYLVRCVRDNN